MQSLHPHAVGQLLTKFGEYPLHQLLETVLIGTLSAGVLIYFSIAQALL